MASPSGAPAKKTIALYQRDGTLHQHTTTISSINPLSSQSPETLALFKTPPDEKPTPYILTTPSTIFHAQGGGQPSDTGTITLAPSTPPHEEQPPSTNPVFKVSSVRSQPPSILHLGTFHPSTPSTIFPPNAPITQAIDIPTRHLHSRLHTGGHALGLAVMSLTDTLLPADLKEGKASHSPGTASVEFLGLIPGTAKGAIQDAVDGLVARDLRVLIHFVDEEEARARCGEVANGVKGDEVDGVRVVELEGAGAYPCGGTHVQTLKEVGRVVVKGIKRQKGVSKVSYEVVDA